METVPEGVGLSQELWDSLDPAVKAVIAGQAAQVRALTERVRDLEARLNQNSSNSSRPPSSDLPWDKPVKRRKPPSGRKRGGQKGHPPHCRELVAIEQVDEVREYKPSECAHCSHRFDDADPVGDVRRHQVFDVPEVQAHVVEHRLYSRSCPDCKKTTRHPDPDGIPLGNFGPRLQALVAVLTVRYRLSKRDVRHVIGLLAGIAVSLGCISDIERNVSEALEIPVEQIQRALEAAKVVHHDETGWREENQKAWLWTTVTENYAVYRIELKRDGEVARSLLGGASFLGHVVTDRYKAYTCYPMERRGICHSHLQRDYQKIADRVGPAQNIGMALVNEERQVFHFWHQFKDGKLSRPQLQSEIEPTKERVLAHLMAASVCGDAKVRGMCKDILRQWDAIWLFLYIEGVEPTNNTAEQALRQYVLWRKGCFGTQSERGSIFAGRMMSIVETCRRQGRNLYDFVFGAVKAWIEGDRPPSLILTG